MINTILLATENFCIHQIRLPHVTNDILQKKRTLIAYIDIDAENGLKYRVYISADENFMQRVSTIFLEEENNDQETLIDMLLELTNLVVGSAKVLAEDSDNAFTIQTPHFEKFGVFDFSYDDVKVIQVENDKLAVAIKEID